MAVPIAAAVRTAPSLLGQEIRQDYFIRVWQMDIGEVMKISFTAKLDKTNPKGIDTGKYSAVTFGAMILVSKPIQQEAATCPQ
jgi:hypothetical protein